MGSELTRRNFVGAAGTAVASGILAGKTLAGQVSESPSGERIKIVGVCCSPRAGKSTAVSLKACLRAAEEVDPDGIEIEMIELADMKIPGNVAAGVPLEPGERDDFPQLVPKLSDPKVAGVIVGTPVYFSNMSSLCKAFLDRCIAFRKMDFALSGKVAGVLAVGGARNGGQELTVQSVQAALLCQDMILVGTGPSSTRSGAMLWSQSDREISEDEIGMTAARELGRRVAEVARRLAAVQKG
jgi:multimeric flavodoxin WrbA